MRHPNCAVACPRLPPQAPSPQLWSKIDRSFSSRISNSCCPSYLAPAIDGILFDSCSTVHSDVMTLNRSDRETHTLQRQRMGLEQHFCWVAQKPASHRRTMC